MSESEDGSFGQDPLTSSLEGPCDDHELLATTEAFARGFDCVSISSFPGERLIQGQEDTASIISTATLVPECIYIPPAGYQLLSEQEWVQQRAALQSTAERLEKVTQEKEALQDALRCSSEDCANQVKQLLEQIKSSEEILQGLQKTLSDTQQKTSQKMAALTASFSRMCQEVNCLDDENEKLRTLSVEAPPAGQNAQLSSPQRAAQHRQERLCIEIVSLQEELKAEQVAKQEVEEQLRRAADTHTEEREIMEATLSSLRTEMERIQQDRKQAELQLQELEGQVQKLWESLGDQEKVLQQEKEEKTSLDLALGDERNKVSRLQTELRTSEEVQRDFVRLSQKLQVSLEKIRQATSMEDVHDILEGTRFTDVSQLSDA
ncbi:rab GTPase-binding effector protein 2 [Phyllobates terribilis]|uniref:rab GTPase-binding effector protein 2 n=1 Tax=Phyllobates terribilis TaxID=111132 RepID=UPI003CCAC517